MVVDNLAPQQPKAQLLNSFCTCTSFKSPVVRAHWLCSCHKGVSVISFQFCSELLSDQDGLLILLLSISLYFPSFANTGQLCTAWCDPGGVGGGVLVSWKWTLICGNGLCYARGNSLQWNWHVSVGNCQPTENCVRQMREQKAPFVAALWPPPGARARWGGEDYLVLLLTRLRLTCVMCLSQECWRKSKNPSTNLDHLQLPLHKSCLLVKKQQHGGYQEAATVGTLRWVRVCLSDLLNMMSKDIWKFESLGFPDSNF